MKPVFECARNCGPFQDFFQNQHIVMLHELAEVATNPDGGGWASYLNSTAEVSDLVSFLVILIFIYIAIVHDVVLCHGWKIHCHRWHYS